MRSKQLSSVTMLLLALSALDAAAQPSEAEMEERRAQWRSMSDEEKAAKREEARERYESMSEEEKAAKREEMRERFESMSEEEREEFRQRRANRNF